MLTWTDCSVCVGHCAKSLSYRVWPPTNLSTGGTFQGPRMSSDGSEEKEEQWGLQGQWRCHPSELSVCTHTVPCVRVSRWAWPIAQCPSFLSTLTGPQGMAPGGWEAQVGAVWIGTCQCSPHQDEEGRWQPVLFHHHIRCKNLGSFLTWTLGRYNSCLSLFI